MQGQANNFRICYAGRSTAFVKPIPNTPMQLPDPLSNAVSSPTPYPGGKGRGIVIVGGGRDLASAYVALRHLRATGCDLPIQLWHPGEKELAPFWSHLVAGLHVTAVDATKLPDSSHFKKLDGEACKVQALTS